MSARAPRAEGGLPPREIALAVLIAALWGVSFVAIKAGAAQAPPLFLIGTASSVLADLPGDPAHSPASEGEVARHRRGPRPVHRGRPVRPAVSRHPRRHAGGAGLAGDPDPGHFHHGAGPCRCIGQKTRPRQVAGRRWSRSAGVALIGVRAAAVRLRSCRSWRRWRRPCSGSAVLFSIRAGADQHAGLHRLVERLRPAAAAGACPCAAGGPCRDLVARWRHPAAAVWGGAAFLAYGGAPTVGFGLWELIC